MIVCLAVCRSQPGGRRRAYMGHLVLIANYVIDFEKQGKNSTKIHQLIQGLDEDLRSDWRDFVDNKMAETNRNNEIVSVKVRIQIKVGPN